MPAQRRSKTRLASKRNAIRNGTDKTLLKQQTWLVSRLSDLKALLSVHGEELALVETEIGKRKTEGKWQYDPTRDEQADSD